MRPGAAVRGALAWAAEQAEGEEAGGMHRLLRQQAVARGARAAAEGPSGGGKASELLQTYVNNN